MALFWSSVVVALIDWYAVGTNRKKIEYAAKPTVMILLILWFLLQGVASTRMGWFFTLGMVFCLLGDVLLMLPQDNFRQGLVAFLIGHVFYIVALNDRGALINVSSGLIALLVAILAFFLVRFIFTGLQSEREHKLRIPISIYSAALSLTAWSGISALLRPEWTQQAAWFVALGGTLFFASDALLAINRFVRPLPGGRLIHMVAYHLSQFGLALGVWMFLR
jgi:uncharacterized membrane protein YhhN